MAITYLNSTQTFNTSGALSTTGASLFVAAVTASTSTGNPTDSQNNTWNALTQYGVSGLFLQLWYVFNPTTSASHTFTSQGSGNTVTFIAWFSGTTTTSAVFDVGTDNGSVITTGTTNTTIQPGSITPAGTGELLFASVADASATGATYSINNSFNVVQTRNNFDNVGSIAYLIDSGNSAINPTWTRSANAADMVTNIAAFKPFGASTGGSNSSWLTVNLNNSLRGLRH